MRYLLTILILITAVLTWSQQEFEICENTSTFTYTTTIDMQGTIVWFLNGYQIGQGESVSITYDEPGEYELVAIGYNDLDCPGTPQVLNIAVTKCDPLIYWVPNSFTPDSDEFNQTWGPILTSGISLENYSLFIYNRWGVLIWESHDASHKWDGTFNGLIVPDGTYTWFMTLDMLENDGKKKVSGHVTIVR